MKVIECVFEQSIRETVKIDTIEEWLMSAAIPMYQGISAVCRTAYGSAECYAVKVSGHQVPVARRTYGL